MRPIHERRRRSARETFGNCQFRYAAEYVHDIESGNGATRRGSTFHLAREHYIRALWQARETDNLDFARAALLRALSELPLAYADELDCVDLWMRYIERFRLPLEQFYAVETDSLQMFSTFLKYDLVLVPNADTLRINDAKTNWSLPPQSVLDAAYQPAFYLAAARLLFHGFARYEFEYDFVRFNQTRIITKTDADLDAFEESIMAQDTAMETAEAGGVFPATGGAHCGTCLVASCPVASNPARYPARLLTAGEAATAVREAAALHRALEVREEALRAYASHYGPVSAGGVEWAHRPVERRVYPAKDVLAILAAHEVTFPLTFNGTAVKPLITSKRKYKAVEDDIKAVAITTVKTEFRPKTVVETEEREYQDAED